MNIKISTSKSVDFLCLWAIARLPLLFLVIYLLSPETIIWLGTVLTIHLGGTLLERLFFFVLIFTVVAVSILLAKKWLSKQWQYLAPLFVAFILFLLLFYTLPGLNFIVVSLFFTFVLGLNIIPDNWLSSIMANNTGRRVVNTFFALAIVISELFLLKSFLLWLGLRCRNHNTAHEWDNHNLTTWMLPTVLVSVWASLFLNVYSLADFHRTLFPDPAVKLFAKGDFNWLELDVENRTLYVSGHGINHLQAYNLDELDRPSQTSDAETGYAQSFAYNPLDRELYVYHEQNQELLIFEAITLTHKKSIPTPKISTGDSFLVWDRFSDSVIIVSEADEEQGIPLVVVSRATGQILDARYVESNNNIILHPTEPLLYINSSRKDRELIMYNTQQHNVVQQSPTSERLNRMAFVSWPGELELLVADPLNSLVLRFDPRTLARKEPIKTSFGGRSIAVDLTRNLLFVGNLFTNKLIIIDLTTNQRIAEYYLGPWLRTIVLDSSDGTAYVSSHEGLFTVKYIKP